jgi:glycosyltransferase involved in cell wall biosynthesis
MIRILINSSTFVNGGGIQIGISMVEFLVENESIDFDFKMILSNNLYTEVADKIKNDTRFIKCIGNPSKILDGFETRKQIKQIEAEFKPNIVYSVSFPSYIKFKTFEVARFTNPWEIYPKELLPFKTLNFKEFFLKRLESVYKYYWASKASYFEVQNNLSRSFLLKKFNKKDSEIRVFPNSPNKAFDDIKINSVKEDGRFYVFCLAAAYAHKNLILIPEVAKLLIDHKSLTFITTIPENHPFLEVFNLKCEQLGVSHMVKNVGKIKLAECVSWYSKSSIVFLPTLLEVFSATYLEAMKMGVPIATSDFEFNTDVCGDAALYFDPYSAKSASNVLIQLIENEKLRESQIEKGFEKIKEYPSVLEKHVKIFKWINMLASNKG